MANNTLNINIKADGVAAERTLNSIGKSLSNVGDSAASNYSKTRRGLESISEQLQLAKLQFIGFHAVLRPIGELIQKSIQAADGYSAVSARLKLATQSAVEFAKAQSDVDRITSATQTGLAEVTTLYGRLSASTKGLGVAQQTLADTTEAVALGLKISGASAGESASAMLQLSQAIASGVLRGEEFNAVNEAAPRLMQALADSIGRPVGELRKLAENGQLTRDVLLQALPAALGKLRDEAASIPPTIGGAFTELENAFTRYVGKVDQARGASASLVGVIQGAARHFETLANAAMAIGGAVVLAGVGRLAGAVYAVGRRAFEAAAIAATARTNIGGLSAALGQVQPVATLAQRGVGLASTALSGLAGVLGGPAGVIAMMVAGAGAFALIGNSAESAAEKTLRRIAELKRAKLATNPQLELDEAEKRLQIIRQGFPRAGKPTPGQLRLEKEQTEYIQLLQGMMSAPASAPGVKIELPGGAKGKAAHDPFAKYMDETREARMAAFEKLKIQALQIKDQIKRDAALKGIIEEYFKPEFAWAKAEEEWAAQEREHSNDTWNAIIAQRQEYVAAAADLDKEVADKLRDVADRAYGDGLSTRFDAVERDLAEHVARLDAVITNSGMSPAAAAAWKEKMLAPINLLADAAYKQAGVEGAREEIGKAMEARQNRLATIQSLVTAGAISETAAHNQATQANRDALTSLEPLVNSLQALADSGYPPAIKAMEQYRAELMAIQDQARDKTWIDGIQQGLKDVGGKFNASFDQSRKAVERAFKGMEDALLSFVKTGKLNFKDLSGSIIDDLIRIQIQQSITKPLSSAMSGFNWGSLKFWADGGVPGGTGLHAYANSIVSQPTLFAFARGAGVMGEAGPEAIMPLTRGPDGRLGVQAQGAGGGVTVEQHITIDARGSAAGVEQRIAAGMRQAQAAAVAEINRSLMRGGRTAQLAGVV